MHELNILHSGGGLRPRRLRLALLSGAMLLAIETQADIIDDLLSSTADSQRRLAVIEARKGHYDAALNAIEEAIAKDSSSPDLLCDKICILNQAGRYKDALETGKSLPASYKRPPYLDEALANCLYKAGRLEESLGALDKALQRNPSSKSLRETYAAALTDSALYDNALALCNAAPKEQQQAMDEIAARALRGKGVAQARLGNFDAADKLLAKAQALKPEDKGIDCDRAVALSWAERHAEAIALYESLPKDFKAPAYLDLEMAKSYLATGKPSKAETLCRKLLAGGQDDPNAAILLAKALSESKRKDDAIATLRSSKAPSKGRDEALAKALAEKGVALARDGKSEQALSCLEESNKLAPSPKTLSEIIVALSWDGRHREAVASAQKLPKDCEAPNYLLAALAKSLLAEGDAVKSLDCSAKILKVSPDDKDAQLLQLKALLRLKMLDEAKSFAKSHKLDNPALAAVSASSLQEDAAALAREGKYNESLALMQDGLSLEPDSMPLRWDRIVVLSWAERHEEALKAFDSMPQGVEPPDYVRPALAKSAREMAQNERAIAAYKDLLERNPARSDMAAALASLLASARGYEEAAEFVDERLKARPEETKALNKALSEGVQSQALTLARKGQGKEAMDCLAKALARDGASSKLNADYLALLSWNGLHKEAAQFYGSLKDQSKLPNYALDAAARSCRETGDYQGCEKASMQALKNDPADMDAAMNYMLSCMQRGDLERAKAFANGRERLSGKSMPELQGALGLACLEAGHLADAKEALQKALSAQRPSAAALAAMGKLKLKEGSPKEALELSDKALARNPQEMMAIQVRAQSLEKLDDIVGAYVCYEEMARLGDRSAVAEKYRLLGLLGANSKALEAMHEKGDSVPAWIEENLRGNRAAAMLRRGDASKASPVLDEGLRSGSMSLASRSRYDGFIAMRELRQMDKIIADYENMERKGEKAPFWVVQSAGDAYLYKRKPERALELYKLAEKLRAEAGLDKYPDNYQPKMAIYYAYLELEDFNNAAKTLDELDAQMNPKRLQRGIYMRNWDKQDLAIERGWLLIYQDRLAEAEKYLATLGEKAPNNGSIRQAQAYLHLYRGWPRRALEDFKILTASSPKSKSGRIGLAYALDANDQWEDARDLARQLAAEFPEDSGVKRLRRTFDIEEMRRERIDFDMNFEQGQTDSFTLSQRMDQPVYPHRNVYLQTVWMHVTKGGLDDDSVPNSKEVFRNEVGIDWRLYNDLTIRAAGSLDYQAKHPGASVGFDYALNDQWTLSADYTSYSLHAPGWVYLVDSYAQEYDIALRYRQSEDFNAEIVFNQLFIAKDGNMISGISARQDKAIYTSHNWKLRLATEQYFTMYAKKGPEIAYYSPGFNSIAYITPYVEHLWYRHYDFSMLDRIYVAPGVQMENGHGINPAGYVRYEQEWNINDTTSFVASVTGSVRNYDGKPSAGLGVHTALVFHF